VGENYSCYNTFHLESQQSGTLLSIINDLPDLEEKAAEQWALLASFESAKKADNVARARV
jgi:hypothetical protein